MAIVLNVCRWSSDLDEVHGAVPDKDEAVLDPGTAGVVGVHVTAVRAHAGRHARRVLGLPRIPRIFRYFINHLLPFHFVHK